MAQSSHQPQQPQLSTLPSTGMSNYAVPMSPSPSSPPPMSPDYDQMTTKWRNPILPSDPNMAHPLDDASRASEEAKRLRNTAASARFRAKKKQREMELERMAQEKADRAAELESKVSQLEMENNFLKSLLTEKNDRTKGQGGATRKGKKVERNAGERSTRGHTDGVGTDEEEVD
ncbi:uncharacterized protein BDZ99DRAFT_457067, partial [Mytilinidion resinicola]